MRQPVRRLGAAGLVVAIFTFASAHRAPTAMASRHRAAVRVALLYDMEGASGVVSAATMDAAQPDSFAVGRASVIDDVNAVVAGLFDGGATQVDVENTHGTGGDSLVPRARLDKRAGTISRSQLDPYILGPRPGQPGFGGAGPRPPYDVVVTVGMHDKPRSGGFSPHTLGAGITPIIDGKAVTETELVGYNVGRFGIPVIYASGDDRLQASLAAAMPWVEYAVVKRITAPTVTQSLPREQVQRTLHDAAVRAMRTMDTPGKMRVMQLSTPFRAGLLPSYPLMLPPGIGNLPGITKRGDTVTFMANDYPSAYWGMFVLQRIARALSNEQLFFEVARDSGGMAAVKRATDSSWARWAAFEAGKWTPP